MPTTSRLIPAVTTPAAHASLLATATSTSTTPNARLSRVTRLGTSTWIPIRTKKSGTNRLDRGCRSSESVAFSPGGADPFPVGVQEQASGEGADDSGQTDPLGDERQREADGQAEHQEHVVLASASCEPDDGSREAVAEPDRDAEEHDGLQDDPHDREPREPGRAGRGRGHQAGHHRQHHESENIVQHGRAEDHLPLTTLEGPQVFQNPGRDADARGRERCPDEQVGEHRDLGQQPPSRPPPEHKRGGHADGGHERGRGADPGECPQVSLQSDVEQEDQHADLGQHVQRGVAAHEGDPAFAEERWEEVPRADPHEQLAEDRGLPPPFRQDPAALRGQHEERQSKQDRAGPGRGVRRRRPGADGDREEDKPGAARPAAAPGGPWPRYAAEQSEPVS